MKLAGFLNETNNNIRKSSSATLVVYGTDQSYKNSNNLKSELDQLSNGDFVFVIVSNNSKRFYRLCNYLLRPYFVFRAQLLMRNSGVECAGVYAVYPNIDNIVAAYRCGSSAAIYAEKKLIPARSSMIYQWIFSRLSKIIGSAPSVDDIVVVGRKND